MDNQNITANKRPLINRIIKIAIFSLLLCLVMYMLLAHYLETVPTKIAELEEEGNMTNTIWLVRYSSYLPPVIVVAILLTLFYKFGNSYIPVKTQRDKALIVTLVLLFTYCVLLPIVCAKSAGWQAPPPEGEEDVKSVLELSIGWFCAQIIPFAMVIGYHLVRASSEKKELSENEE